MNKVFVSHVRNVFPVVFAQHEIAVTEDKQIAHYIDGRHVATVPPEGWADYVREYPEAADVVESLTIKPIAQIDEIGDNESSGIPPSPVG